MGKCNTEQVLSMIGVNKLTKAQELFFRFYRTMTLV